MSGAYLVSLDTAPPKSRAIITVSSLSNPEDSLSASILAHPFNHAVEIVVPRAGAEPAAIAALGPTGKDRFYSVLVSPAAFLSKDFTARYLQQGRLLALSQNSRIDQDDTIAVLPTGLH